MNASGSRRRKAAAGLSRAGAEPPPHEEMDPFIHRRVELRRADGALGFLTAHSLFSSQAIDAGTLLLLDHLPEGEPRRFLDLGSGYGALGLAVAARFPGSSGLLADRDL